nr:hypothetical protein [Sinorhizobium sojae]
MAPDQDRPGKAGGAQPFGDVGNFGRQILKGDAQSDHVDIRGKDSLYRLIDAPPP